MKKATDYLIALLLFLLPLKFGSLAVMPESGGFFPEFFIDWFNVTNWHPHALGYFTTPLLLLAIFNCAREKADNRTLLFMLFWCIVPVLAVLPGMIRGDHIVAQGELSLLSGCAPLIAAVCLQLKNRPEKATIYLSAILLGCVTTAFYGWYQHFVSLPELREYVAMQEAEGIPVGEGMKLKLTDPRIYSTLASSNTLASLLMLAVICSFWAGSCFSKYITPPQQGKWAIWIFALLIFIPIMVLTRSRSIIVCPVAAGLLALFSHPGIKIRWKLAGIAAGIIIVAGGIALAYLHGRNLASMGERADYWRTCAILCKEHPFTGAGWNEFFKTHMQIKLSAVDESARDPHNVVAAFASQCGIFSGLLMLAVLLLPLVILWKHRFESGIPGVVFWCGTIFTLHSMIDCDWQIPALISIMGVLYACALAQLPGKECNRGYVNNIMLTALALTAVAGVWISGDYLNGDYALSRLQDKVNPGNMEIRQQMANIPFEKLYQEAKNERPKAAITEIIAGDWYFQHYQERKAEEHYLRALELDPVRPAAYARLAKLELQKGNRENAEKLMHKAHLLFPRSRFYKMEKLYGN